jgi:DNA mismatch repair protein MutS
MGRRAPWLFVADCGRRLVHSFLGVHDLSGFGYDD